MKCLLWVLYVTKCVDEIGSSFVLLKCSHLSFFALYSAYLTGIRQYVT